MTRRISSAPAIRILNLKGGSGDGVLRQLLRKPSHRFAGLTIGFLPEEVNNENVYTVAILTPFNESFAYTKTFINRRFASRDGGFDRGKKAGMGLETVLLSVMQAGTVGCFFKPVPE
ncbi:MAG: hypothetical protein C0469_11795 [Cyanobacteria bacterium DS2.3.42]|nr:hypothetical protein [Cyanobacteria bacterium DS2.3.42]